jgi:hypothetical protein
MQNIGCHSMLLNQNLHLSKSYRLLVTILKLEKHSEIDNSEDTSFYQWYLIWRVTMSVYPLLVVLILITWLEDGKIFLTQK